MKQHMFPSLAGNVLVIYLKRTLRFIFLISFLIYLFLLIFKLPLPGKSEILPEILEKEPLQTEIPPSQKDKPIIRTVGEYEYRLKPLYNYEIYGLIVTDYDSDNWMDVRHKDDPGNIKDICVVWGENIKNGSYKEVKFSSGEFTCFFSWSTPENKFSGRYLANNHVIAQNEHVRSMIKKSRVGDQVRIKGILVDYSVYSDGKEISTRKTSTKRDDAGNGACEIIYVSDFEIIKENPFDRKNIRSTAGYTALGSGFIGFLLFLLI